MADDRRPITAQAVRFVIAGAVNTAVTGATLSLLSLVMSPQLAYPIVFAAGIGLATFLADKMVYGVPMDGRSKAWFAVLYVGVFGVGWLFIRYLLQVGLPEHYSGTVVFVTAPLTFVGGRVIADRAARRHQGSEST